MRKHKLLVILAVALAVITLAAACSSPAPTATVAPTYTPYPTYTPAPMPTQPPVPTGQPTYTPYPTYTPQPTFTPVATPTAAVQAKTLLIGDLDILSGSGTGYGIPANRGVARGIELWNDGGGVVAGGTRYLLKADTYDWGYTVDTGRTAAEKAMNDGCTIIFGVGTGPAAGAQQATEPNKVLLFAQATSDDMFSSKYPYSFRINLGAIDQYAPAMSYIQKTYPTKTKLFATIWNDATGQLVWNAWKPGLEKMGWSKLDFQYYQPGTTDDASFVTSYLLPANDDIFAMVSRTGEAGAMVKAARQYGFKGIIAWLAAAGAIPELQIAGNLADGTILSGQWDWNGPFVPQAAKPEALLYISKYGDSPAIFYFQALEAMRMLAAALQKAGTPDTTALKDALPTVTWDSYFGGTGKLYPVGDRPGATFDYGTPVSEYDAKTQSLVNIGFGVPPSLNGQ